MYLKSGLIFLVSTTFFFQISAFAGGAATFPCTIKRGLRIVVTISNESYLASNISLTHSKSPHSMSATLTNTSNPDDTFRAQTQDGDCSVRGGGWAVSGVGVCSFDSDTNVVFNFDRENETCEITALQ